MNIDTYKNGRKLLDIKNVNILEENSEPISLKTSKNIRKINRYKDYYLNSKAITIYRDIQPYTHEELRTVTQWYKKNRKPKSYKYVFCMRSNMAYAEWYDYCFVEDTRPFTEQEKEKKRAKRRQYLKNLKERKEEQKRQEGIWKTSWQWLKEDNRKIVENSVPEERYNWIYDEASDSFEEASKAFYYYSEYDTIQVSQEEYKELKRQYIAKFGGWEKIDLEHTEYNGKKWY